MNKRQRRGSRGGDWASPMEGGDIEAAVNGVKTPESKPKKEYGLGPNRAPQIGGGSRRPPAKPIGMGQYDNDGNLLPAGAGKGPMGGTTMKASSSGTLRRDQEFLGSAKNSGKKQQPSKQPRGQPLQKHSLQFFHVAGAKKSGTRPKSTQAIVPGASLSCATGVDSARGGGGRVKPSTVAVQKRERDREESLSRWDKQDVRGQGGSSGNGWARSMAQSNMRQYGSTGNGRGSGGSSGRDRGDRNQLTSLSKPRLATPAATLARRHKKGQQFQQEKHRRHWQQGGSVARKARPITPQSPEIVDILDDSSSDDDDGDDHDGDGGGGDDDQDDGEDDFVLPGGDSRKRRRPGGGGTQDGEGRGEEEEEREWCNQTSDVRPASGAASASSSASRQDGAAQPRVEQGESSNRVVFGALPKFEAIAVMVGKWVVLGDCRMSVNMNGTVTITLKGSGEAKDTTLAIPEKEIISFSFSPEGGRKNLALIAIKTNPSGDFAKDPAYRQYDPSDKGVAGFITLFLAGKHGFHEHEKCVNDYIFGEREAGLSVDTNLEGELPRILRQNLTKHIKEAREDEEGGRVRARRTLRSGGVNETSGKVLFQYPAETSASDRVAINSMDEARTQEGEFLNDSLVDLYLKYMHREAFRTWASSGGGGSGSGADGSVTDGEGGGEGKGKGKEKEKEPAGASGGTEGEGGSAAAGEGEEATGGAGARGSAVGSAAGAAAAGVGGGGNRVRARAAMDDGKVHIFTSHFFTKLTEGGNSCSFDESYRKVQHWARNVDLFSKKFVFVPVVEDMHWSLACLCNLDKLKELTDEDEGTNDYKLRFGINEERPCMLFLDSLNMHYASRIGDYLRKYLQMKWRESKHKHQGMVFDKNVLPLVSPRVPTQINGCDCGVYVLRYAKEICQRWPLVTRAEVTNRMKEHFWPELFSPSDIKDERRKLKELLEHLKVRYDEQKQKQKSTKGKGKAAGTAGSSTGSSTGTSGGGGSSSPPQIREPAPAPAAAKAAPPEAAREGPPALEATQAKAPAPLPADADKTGAEGSTTEAGRTADNGGDQDGAGGGGDDDGTGSDDATDTDTEIDEGTRSAEAGRGSAGAEEGSGSGAEAEATGGGNGGEPEAAAGGEEEEEAVSEGEAGDKIAALQLLRSAMPSSGGPGGSSSAQGGGGGGNGDKLSGPLAVVLATSSDESAGVGGFHVAGSCWGAAAPASAPEEEKHEAENGTVDMGVNVPARKPDAAAAAAAAAAGGGSKTGAGERKDGAPISPIRRKKRKAVGAAAAASPGPRPRPLPDRDPSAGLEKEKPTAGRGNGSDDVEVLSPDGREQQPRCSEPEVAVDSDAKANGNHKSSRAPLQARGKNEDPITPPRPTNSAVGVGGGGTEVVSLAAAADASSLRGESPGGAEGVLVADENAPSPSMNKKTWRKRAMSLAAAAQTEAACSGGRDTPAAKQQARYAPPAEVHAVDSDSCESSDDRPIDEARRDKRERTLKGGAGSADAATTIATTGTVDKIPKRRQPIVAGNVNGLVAKPAFTAVTSSAAATVTASGLAAPDDLDDDDNGDETQAEGGAGGRGGSSGSSGRHRTEHGSDAGEEICAQSVSERNKRRRPRTAAANAANCWRPGSGGRGRRELTRDMPPPIGKETGGRGTRRAADGWQTPSPRKRTRSAASPKIDLKDSAGVSAGGGEDEDDVTVVEPSCNGRNAEAAGARGGEAKKDDADTTSRSSPAGKKKMNTGGSDSASKSLSPSQSPSPSRRRERGLKRAKEGGSDSRSGSSDEGGSDGSIDY
eukprot:g19165.t1